MPRDRNPQRVEELIQYFNNAYGPGVEWPKTFEVSPLLYANVCQTVFNHMVEKGALIKHGNAYIINVAIGENNGIMFKHVELIMK